MTNFKVGQNVVYIGKDSKYPKKPFHVIKSIRKTNCNCDKIEIDCGYIAPSGASICKKCEHIDVDGIFWKVSDVFRPLTYQSATSEILEKFKLTEEKADVEIKELQTN